MITSHKLTLRLLLALAVFCIWKTVPNSLGPVTQAQVRCNIPLNVIKDGPATASAGSQITYIVAVANPTSTPTINTTLTDTLPPGFTAVSATATVAAVTIPCAGVGTGTVTCDLGTFPGGGQATITIVAQIPVVCQTTTAVNTAVATHSTCQVGSIPATFTTIVNPPPPLTITKSGPATANAGTNITYTITVTNPSPGAAAPNTLVTDTLPAGFTAVSATPSVPGACSGIGTGTVTCNLGTLPGGGQATITLVAHVPAVCQPATAVNMATVGNDACPGNMSSASFTTTVNQPALGAGACIPPTSQVSDDKPGSIAFYNFYTSGVADATQNNTRISLTNTHPTRGVAVHLYFVDGATCSVADLFICLTANQTAAFLMSDIDPGISGYIVAVAVDGPPGFGDGNNTGCPISFNFLIGHASIKMPTSGASFSFGNSALVAAKPKRIEDEIAAESVAALFGSPVPGCNPNSFIAELRFDGTPTGYNLLPRTLAASNIPSRADGNETLLIINRIGGNLATGAATLGRLFGILYDDTENGFSFQLEGGCQLRGSLGNNFPRTAPRFDTLIPAGRSGWLKIYALADIAILGAQINNNVNFDFAANAFDGGHNLHKLTLTNTAVLTVPVFPPNC